MVKKDHNSYWLIIMGEKGMNNNLVNLIEFINDHLLFGSSISTTQLTDLFEQYYIEENEKKFVLEELKSLNISVIKQEVSLSDKLDSLFLELDRNLDVNLKWLQRWFKKEKIPSAEQKIIKSTLTEFGYKFVDSNKKTTNISDLQIFEHLNFDDLDQLLDSDDFKNEVNALENVIDKKYNLDYLQILTSSETEIIDKKDALNNLAIANERLVYKIALRYRNFTTTSFDIEDMFQAGMQGLMKAAEKFDISKGFQFSTYATHWIKQGISRSIADYSTTIRVPVHMREKIIQLTKVENEFWKNNGEEASVQVIADILDTTPEQVEELKIYKELANLTSLDLTIGEDKSTALQEFLKDDADRIPENIVSEILLKEEFQNIFKDRLTEKEARILNTRFGLLDGQYTTLEAIGQIENVTRERIRQIEAKAISKLQDSKSLERLEGFYYVNS